MPSSPEESLEKVWLVNIFVLTALMEYIQIFQQVEEESERRAQEESTVASKPPLKDANLVKLDTLRVKERRRGSISISHFGQARAMFLPWVFHLIVS